MAGPVRWLAVLLIAGFVALAWSADGRAQESSTVTITLIAEGATPEDRFPMSVTPLEAGVMQEFEATPGVPVTLDVVPGVVVVLAQVPVGWAFDEASCTGSDPFVPVDFEPTPDNEFPYDFSFAVPAGVAVDCVLTDVPAPTGTVRLTQTVIGPNPEPLAEHRVDVGRDGRGVLLRADETIEVPVNAGTVGISARQRTGFGTFIIDCGDAVVARISRQVSIDVPVDGVVDCDVISVAAPVATLRIEKFIPPAEADRGFPFRVGDFEFEIQPSFAPGFGDVAFALGPGPYEFVELPSDGWFLRQVSCSGFGVELIDQGVRVAPVQGEDISCSFTNELLDQTVGQPGDANCDGMVDIIDALVIAQLVAEVRSEVQQCPLGDAAVEVFGPAADVDDSGTIDIIDALVVARCSAGLPAVLCPEQP